MKKGFTLVELLVVIALIGLLIAIAVPSGIAISNKIKKKMLDTKIETIEQGAIVWGQNNKKEILLKSKGNCKTEELLENSSVTHCISTSISDLLNKNALEEDKLDEEGNKILINPVTNKPLNNCNVEIYIKNKRVYAKYDINGTNCGYEKSEEKNDPTEEIPYFFFEDEVYAEMISSYDMLELYKKYPDIFEKVTIEGDCIAMGACNANYYNIYDGLKLIKGSELIDIWAEEDVEVSEVWNSSNMSWTYTYTFTGNYTTTVENAEKIMPITRTIYLYDRHSPIIINSSNEIIQSDEYIDLYECDACCGNSFKNYFIFDNLDGIKPLTEPNYEYDAFNSDDAKSSILLKDSKGNSNILELKRLRAPLVWDYSKCDNMTFPWGTPESDVIDKLEECLKKYTDANYIQYIYHTRTSSESPWYDFNFKLYDSPDLINDCYSSATINVWWPAEDYDQTTTPDDLGPCYSDGVCHEGDDYEY